MQKPKWAIHKDSAKREERSQTHWLFGLHAVRDALENPKRRKIRLVVTRNALSRLEEAVAASGLVPEICEPRNFTAPLDKGSVHQGAALEVHTLDWGKINTVQGRPLVLLDRVSDPHNVGAILRSAEVFGAGGVVAPRRHAASETGALAKAASGALERLPYFRIGNLAATMAELSKSGYCLIGLDGMADIILSDASTQIGTRPFAIVMGAEGPGLRQKTREMCDFLARIPAQGEFGSLNVSNAVAVALYALLAHGCGK